MLDKIEINALKAVESGADIISRSLAITLRKLEKEGLVKIGETIGHYDPTRQLPYFGAIVTSKGKDLLRQIPNGK